MAADEVTLAAATREAAAFTGLFTALVTPFRDGELDLAAFAALAERQIAAGVQGLVVATGAAGEAATLRFDEVERLIRLGVQIAAGRVPIIADVSANATAATIARIRQARDLGADAALVTAPWYNRPSQEGIFRHYEAVAEAAGVPILVGNEPARTRVDITADTVRRLTALPGIVGLADASGDLARIDAVAEACPDWTLLSADDRTSLGYRAYGGHGAVSLAANVAPKASVALHAACKVGDWPVARRLQHSLFQLQAILAVDPTPSASKLALSMLGLCQPEVRLPITTGADALRPALARALAACGSSMEQGRETETAVVGPKR